MAAPNTNWEQLATTTLYNRTKKLSDNVTKHNALLKHLKKKGQYKTFSGGISILQEVEYQEAKSFGWYSGTEQLNITPTQFATAAEFPIKQASVSFTMSGLEQLQNAGEERMIELMGAKMKNAEKTLTNQVALACYSDGTGSGGKEIGGVQHIIADTATSGIVGGINRATWTVWQNQTFDCSSNGGVATAANIEGYMDDLWLSLVRGADKPTAIFFDNAYYKLFWQSQQALRRIGNDEDSADDSFSSLKFQNARVYYDGGIGGGAPTSHGYFVNSDYVFFRPHAQRNFVPIGGKRESFNQDAFTKFIGFAGNITTSGPQFLGVIKN